MNNKKEYKTTETTSNNGKSPKRKNVGKIVSKSVFTNFIKCPKLCWLEKHKQEEKDVSSKSQKSMEEGTEFGLLAQGYFGDCIDVAKHCKNDIPHMLNKTRKEIELGTENICEATFSIDGLYCQIDILHKNKKNKYDIVEVKSTTSVKDYYYYDVAFQYKTVMNKIDVDKIYILHVNRDYRKKGKLTKDFFVLEDVTEKAKAIASMVDIEKIRKMLNGDEPKEQLSKQCDKGWECPFKKYCSNQLEKQYQSFLNIDGLTWNQKMQCLESKRIIYPKGKEVLSLKNDDVIVDKSKIQSFLNTVKFPIYLIDFETVQQIIPRFKNQKPWQQTVFQISCHKIEKWGENPVHLECISVSKYEDPRKKIAKYIVENIPKNSNIMAYNMMFEKMVLKELSIIFPQYAEHLMSLHDNCIDLMIPFKNRYYYVGSMKASYSIKVVLPTLFPNDETLDYHNLSEVQNGSDAQLAYIRILNMKGYDKKALKHNMLKYCELDTYAMLKVLSFLYGVIDTSMHVY